MVTPMHSDPTKIDNPDDGMTPDVELNLTGMKCPLPVLKARRQINQMAPQSVLKVTADDPAAPLDFEHFCHSKSVIAQAAKIGARKRMSRVVFSEAATVGKAQTNRRSSLVLIKSAGEAAAKMALKKIHRREERDKIKSEMHKSVSLAAQLGKQKSLVRSVATNTAIIGKQKSLIRKVASEVAL